MKRFLKNVPGFRSDTEWKKIVASNFYLIFILLSLVNGLDFFLLGITSMTLVAAIVYLFIDLKEKRPLTTSLALFLITILFFSSGIAVRSLGDIKAIDAEKNAAIEEERLAAKEKEDAREEAKAKREEERLAAQAKRDEEEAKRLDEKESEEERLREEERLAKVEEYKESFVRGRVTEIRDGDTVHVRLDDGQTLRVRMLGINAPETVYAKGAHEYYGKEASDYTGENLFNKEVYLEKDASDRDEWGRSLRYVWVDIPDDIIDKEMIEAKMFNGILVANGYAKARNFYTDTKYQEIFEELEEEARNNKRGMWQ